jgi:hypothetical protein
MSTAVSLLPSTSCAPDLPLRARPIGNLCASLRTQRCRTARSFDPGVGSSCSRNLAYMTPRRPGWYTDPTGRFYLRHWDGAQWGSDVRATPGGTVRTDSIPAEGTSRSGWFPDPNGRHRLRYREGVEWTAWIADDEGARIDPQGAAVAERPKTAFRLGVVWAIGLALIFVLMIIGAMRSFGDQWHCADSFDPSSDACQRDSSGPIFIVILVVFAALVVYTVVTLVRARRARR